MSDREQKIRERAHGIWEEQGRPEGQHHDHWAQAEAEIDAAGNEGLPTPDEVSAIDVAPELQPPPTAIETPAATKPVKKKANA